MIFKKTAGGKVIKGTSYVFGGCKLNPLTFMTATVMFYQSDTNLKFRRAAILYVLCSSPFELIVFILRSCGIPIGV
ncbi:hypothetical protein EV702DRAFT_1142341 [Suillus placidus]|uniref:Uncharacterized protein n=1 Tax=Suillus placidus TaxID=48579 RepID=A0A9P6ZKG9_9AGAM|nr:hypothetical protein EV702DRAFT_1142341 [Suillus placidus]